ncbi:YdcF family protein [Abyssicoccus albus]|uniref:DUF218 domain-containing protein n=1 Tax=Abyssicoccus albus TaxID=1817405 RepID=A0A3N5BK81_9BACL|nr:YdcF family protein [Abyssicoccus albus]RPF58284.1 DUF218 domain-containing protein [Abyssicoccus albus]
MKISKVKLMVIFIILLLLFLDSLNLNYSEKPKKSDVIIMLGGGGPERMEKTAELYRQGYANKVMISPVIEHETSTQSVALAMKLGINREDIIHERHAYNTFTNATYTLSIAQQLEYDSAIIVSSDYHMKRSKMIFDRENRNRFDLTYVSALPQDGTRWYMKKDALQNWSSELKKYWGYQFRLYKYTK